MIFDELKSVLPQPQHPVEVPSSMNWGEIVDVIGFALPVDYMQFVEAYGSGSINRFIYVFNPFSSSPHLNLIRQLTRVLASFRMLKEEFPDEIPFPLLYEPGGLMPWGITDNGDVFCWRTQGVSGHWSTVVVERSSGCKEYEIPMSRFLSRSLTGSLTVSAFPRDFAAQPPVFTPSAG
jgi:hypothetical protein